ncbi:MAG: hypothetical protein VX265_02005 [Myxococcota bacterium]|nr:hypothetical protein [Myxococcota bacterium]
MPTLPSLDGTGDRAAMALRSARDHMDRYYSHRTHDAAAFSARCRMDLAAAPRLTRAQLLDRKYAPARQSGVYCILGADGQRAYVGLAEDFHRRFSHGMGRHGPHCAAGCGHFGHFVNPTAGARDLGLPDADCTVLLLERLPHEGFAICQAEIDWYWLFRANGWQDWGATRGPRMTNRVSALGAKGGACRPVVCQDLQTGVATLFPSLTEAGEVLGFPHGPAAAVVAGWQKSADGFSHRYATAAEVETGEIRAGRGGVWSHGDTPVSVEAANRNSRLRWVDGVLSAADRALLRASRRAAYDKDGPTSGLRGVSWHKRGGWQCRARKGPSSKDLWQVGPRKAWRSDIDAALVREDMIREQGWQPFNRGRTHGSNAAALNAVLATDYVDWEDADP